VESRFGSIGLVLSRSSAFVFSSFRAFVILPFGLLRFRRDDSFHFNPNQSRRSFALAAYWRIAGAFVMVAMLGCGAAPTTPPEHREPVEDLVMKLRDPQESLAVHAEAIQVLGIKGADSPEAVAAVADALLKEKGTLTRQSAVAALRKMHAKAALPKLREAAAHDADPGVRQAAADAVAELEKLP
jgi:hypothetical protein